MSDSYWNGELWGQIDLHMSAGTVNSMTLVLLGYLGLEAYSSYRLSTRNDTNK